MEKEKKIKEIWVIAQLYDDADCGLVVDELLFAVTSKEAAQLAVDILQDKEESKFYQYRAYKLKVVV